MGWPEIEIQTNENDEEPELVWNLDGDEDSPVELRIDLERWANNGMTDEDRVAMAQALCWGPVLERAMEMLKDDFQTSTGLMTGMNDTRWEFLAEVEHEALTTFRWGALKDLQKLAKDVYNHSHIYRKLRTLAREKRDFPVNNLGGFLKDWMENEGIDAAYRSELEGPKDLKQMVDETFEEMTAEHEEAMDA